MKLKTFRGATMAETLAQVKRHFGRHAVILSTRTLTRGGVFGIGEKPYVEITAARGLADLPPPLRRGTTYTTPRRSGPSQGAATQVAPAPQESDRHFDALLSEMSSLKTVVTELVHQSRHDRMAVAPQALLETYQKLIQQEVAEQIAQRLVQRVEKALTKEQLRDAERVRKKLATELEKMIPVAGPIQCRHKDHATTIALIGPTGVGKTTTIAKLAADFCLRQNRKVGLITIDTYRIAAVEQLKTYARIIDVPLDVAATPSQFKQAMEQRAAGCDVVLIDTAGRSQRDQDRLSELQAFFKVCRPDEIHLVLSSTSGEAVLSQTIARFRAFGIDRVLFTKLDEAIGLGVMLSCLQQADAKLSYVTTGQGVPDDLEVGRSRSLAKLILRDGGEPSSAEKG